MSDESQSREQAAAVDTPRGVALFDLDGTLLAWDCQLLFRHFVLRQHPRRRWLLPVYLLGLALAPFLGNDGLKRFFLSYLWRMSPKRLAQLSEGFADLVVAGLYPEVLERLERHRQRGDLIILASASPECYVREIGRRLGCDHALGTPVRHGALIPRLSNHKGVAKVERLREILGAECFRSGKIRNSHGYSDSRADLPMLAVCERVTVVNPKSALASLAEMRGWELVKPQRPWATRIGWLWRVLALLIGVGKDPGRLQSESWKKSNSTSR